LSVTAILCLCELLKAIPYFNFRHVLLKSIGSNMNHSTEEVATACCSAMQQLFTTDHQGEYTLEAVKLLSKVCSSNLRKVQPSCLHTLQSIPLRVHDDEAQALKLYEKANTKKRKQMDSDLEKELRDGEATVNKSVLAKCQSETLHTVTLLYFRILKSQQAAAAVVPAALEGLSKIVHLIHYDVVLDLLKVLKALISSDSNELSLETCLQCVKTAFATLDGPGRELPTDVKEYIGPLYQQLPRLVEQPQCMELALSCIHSAFIKRTEFSLTRVGAVVKQLCTIALGSTTTPHVTITLLALVRRILFRYNATGTTKLQQLLEHELDCIHNCGITSYSHTGEGTVDVEHVQPFATSLWELSLLRKSIHPMICQHANDASNGKMLQFPTEDPLKLLQTSTRHYNQHFIPHTIQLKRHPLAKTQNRGKQRRQMRFITPRPTQHLNHYQFFS